MEQLVLTARLREDAFDRALELAATAHTDGEGGFDRFSIYLSPSEVAFVFEAPDPEHLVRRLLNDPVRAAELSPWISLFDGPLHIAREVYRWSRYESSNP